MELSSWAGWPDSLGLLSRHFGLLLCCDARVVPDRDLRSRAQALLSEGLVYLVAWGPDCPRVEASFDAAFAEAHMNDAEELDSVLMTTSHQSEDLDDALWFFLNTASPDEPYESSCESWLATVVGDGVWTERVQYAVRDPKHFTQEVLDSRLPPNSQSP